jgi:hypothetical protein
MLLKYLVTIVLSPLSILSGTVSKMAIVIPAIPVVVTAYCGARFMSIRPPSPCLGARISPPSIWNSALRQVNQYDSRLSNRRSPPGRSCTGGMPLVLDCSALFAVSAAASSIVDSRRIVYAAGLPKE